MVSGRFVSSLAFFFVLIIIGLLLRDGNTPEKDTVTEGVPIVKTAAVLELSGLSDLMLIGSVRAVDEVEIESKVSGRITNVFVELGDTVYPQQTIAQIENDSEYAALLQAEGAYEAALAAAEQSDVGVADAENNLVAAQNNAISVFQSSYSTVNNLAVSTLDQFFTKSNNAFIGIRINATNDANELLAKRTMLESALSEWKTKSLNIQTASDLRVSLDNALAYTNQALTLLDTFITLTDNAETTEMLSGVTLNTYTASLTASRTTLISTLSSLESAKTALTSAEETLRSAQISGTNTNLSAANARVKQALGTLRAAEANYRNTILTSSIAGTVNELSVNTGDHIGAMTLIARVANNDALEITSYIGDSDTTRLSIGDSVLIEGDIPGTIVAIAPAVDSVTKKTEIKISTESKDITNGDTVTIAVEKDAIHTADTEITIPLAAVKLTANDAAVFMVASGKLVSHDVTLGDVRGSYVVIESGLSHTDTIVADVRGLAAGTTVEVVNALNE